MKYAGDSVYIVVNNGEIVGASYEEELAKVVADRINKKIKRDELLKLGYNIDRLSSNEIERMEENGIISGDYAYIDIVDIPDDYDMSEDENEEQLTERSPLYTNHGDEFTYKDIIDAIDEYIG